MRGRTPAFGPAAAGRRAGRPAGRVLGFEGRGAAAGCNRRPARNSQRARGVQVSGTGESGSAMSAWRHVDARGTAVLASSTRVGGGRIPGPTRRGRRGPPAPSGTLLDRIGDTTRARRPDRRVPSGRHGAIRTGLDLPRPFGWETPAWRRSRPSGRSTSASPPEGAEARPRRDARHRRGRRLRLRRAPQDPQPARRRPRAASSARRSRRSWTATT